MSKPAQGAKTVTGPGEWPSDWPDLGDVLNFWFFGLRRRGLLPSAATFKSESATEAWARRLNLLDKRRDVPEWVRFCASNPRMVEEALSNQIIRQTFKINLPRPHFGPDGPSRIDGEPTPGGTLTLADLVHLGPRTSEGENSNKALWDKVDSSLHYSVRKGERKKTKRRIMKAFETWLEVQLIECEIAVLRELQEQPNGRWTNMTDWERDTFIRFQCEGTPARELFEQSDMVDYPKSRVLKAISRVASRMGLSRRFEKPGRPSGKGRK